MFLILFVLFQIYSSLDAQTDLKPRVDYHSRLKDACSVYEDILPTLFDDIIRLFKDTLHYVFVQWPELPFPPGSERTVDKNTLAKDSVVLEKSILKIQSLVIKDIGRILDEVAKAINLTSLLKKVKASGFKLHVL